MSSMLSMFNGVLSKINKLKNIFDCDLRDDISSKVHMAFSYNCNGVYGSMFSSETSSTSFPNIHDDNNNNNSKNNAKNKTSQYGTSCNHKLNASPTSTGRSFLPVQPNRDRTQFQLNRRPSRLRYSSHEKPSMFSNQTRQMRTVSSNEVPYNKSRHCLSRSPSAGAQRQKNSLLHDNMAHADASIHAKFRPSNSIGTCGFEALKAENAANNMHCQQESANNPNEHSNNMNPTGTDKAETFHLRQVIRINPDSGEVEVQPAVMVGSGSGQVIDQRTHILGDQKQYLLQEDFSKNFRTVSPAGGTQKFYKAPIPNTTGPTRLEYRFQSNPAQGEQTHVTMTADGRTQHIPETNQLDKDFSKLTRQNQRNRHNAVAESKSATLSALPCNGKCFQDSVSCVNNSSDTNHKYNSMDVQEEIYGDAIRPNSDYSDITIEQTIVIDPRNNSDNFEVPPTTDPGIIESRPILQADDKEKYDYHGDQMLPPPPLAPVKSVSFNHDVYDPMPTDNKLKKETSENADWHRMALSGNLGGTDDQLDQQTDENDTDLVDIADSEPL